MPVRMYLGVYLFRLSIYLSLYLSVYLSICIYIYVSVYARVHAHVHIQIHVYAFVYKEKSLICQVFRCFTRRPKLDVKQYKEHLTLHQDLHYVPGFGYFLRC